MRIRDFERRRLNLQTKLDSQRNHEQRNKFGQFATPGALALDILAYAKQVMSPHESVSFLDPAFGTGAFYSALLQSFPAKRIARVSAFEIDPYFGLPALELWHDKPLRLHIEDFTRAMPPATEGEKANLLICNPPYVRHHYIASSEKQRLQLLVGQNLGHALSGLAGLYCYFLLLAHAWLANNGIAGWLIPGEFMDVRYGQQVKKYLLDDVTLLRIHRFDPADTQFGDTLVSSAVVWFRKASPPPEHKVEFTFGGSLLAPCQSGTISTQTLWNTHKWTRFPSATVRTSPPSQQVNLSDLFTIKRGLATGSNEFFILSRQRVEEYRIPREFLIPILPGPRYVIGNEIEADAVGSPLLKRQLFLLNCRFPEVTIESNYPALWRYLEQGIAKGINQRYLCKHRNPWYSQEVRPPSTFLCTYMGRWSTASKSPFRFLLNHSQATVANTYLILYPKPGLQRAIQGHPERIRAVWKALCEITPESLVQEGRVYGGGLHKLEPKELANTPADDILTALNVQMNPLEADGTPTVTQMALSM